MIEQQKMKAELFVKILEKANKYLASIKSPQQPPITTTTTAVTTLATAATPLVTEE